MSKIINLTEKSLPSNCLVFKHSTRCPVSTVAAEEVRAGSFSLDVYWINVVEQRELSNWVAAEYDVVHQSPQLLLLRDSQVVESWSHGSVRRDVVEAALK